MSGVFSARVITRSIQVVHRTPGWLKPYLGAAVAVAVLLQRCGCEYPSNSGHGPSATTFSFSLSCAGSLHSCWLAHERARGHRDHAESGPEGGSKQQA